MSERPEPDDEDDEVEGTEDEALFDEYSRLLAAGGTPPPEQFLASHSSASASAELRAALGRMFRRSARGQAADGKLPFERLGDFKLVRRLGGGGMGIVFLAVQESLGREVALKIIRPELQGSAVAAERFRREARALAELRHPNLVAVFGGGEEHGVRYLAMELVPGDAFDDLLRRDDFLSIPVARRVRWIAGLARALHHAHEKGVVHRDVKPANVRITPDDRALLLDFGLARTEGMGATLTESFAGTPSHAAPEQIQAGGAIDARTDVYSLGVMLYQCLTGKLPYSGATVEQVFHRILTATPDPPRKLAPALPRDLELVTLKAFERDRERRYATAAALADDLEAVLELGPVSARPPSSLERATRLARRYPIATTAAATGLLALVLLIAVFAVQRRTREKARKDEAALAVAAARSRIADWRARREGLAGVQGHVANMLLQMTAMHFTDEQYDVLDRNEARLEEEGRSTEQAYYEVLDLLRQAERLDPQVQGADAVRGELYLERYRDALTGLDQREAEFFRDLAARSDPELARELTGEATLRIESDPPGATVYAFQLLEESKLDPSGAGEPRMVAVPLTGTTPVPPGTWALRVLRDFGPLRRGDHVIEIEGAPIEGSVFVVAGGEQAGTGERLVSVDGAPMRDDWDLGELATRSAASAAADAPAARRFEFEHEGRSTLVEGRSLEELGIEVAAAGRFGGAERDEVRCRLVRDGRSLDALLPPKAPVRATARPVFESAACRLGTTPVTMSARLGDYLLLLRCEGREDVRVALPLLRDAETRIALPRAGVAPDGWVYVACSQPGAPADYWVMEHEVTSEQWRDFLRDPEVERVATIAGRGRYVPRMTGAPNPLWLRDSEGRWNWPSPWRGDWPIVGVTYGDAKDYVAWRNRRAREAGEPFEYALPTEAELWRAAAGGLSWPFVYGLRLRPRWSRCCFSRPRANLGPVLEFPVDESPSGAFDFTGGAYEWTSNWYDEGRGLRMVSGGAWGQATFDHLALSTGMGLEPEQSTGETGLRLVMRIREEAPR